MIQRARVITKGGRSRSLDSLRLGVFAMSFGESTACLCAPTSALAAALGWPVPNVTSCATRAGHEPAHRLRHESPADPCLRASLEITSQRT